MKFTKLQGAGNDFILIDTRQEQRDWGKLAIAMCHRNFGVGGDGILLVLPSDKPGAVAKMAIYNADGSYAEASGNGLRCFARYLLHAGLVPARAKSFVVETGAGRREVRPDWSGPKAVSFQTSMGKPIFEPKDIPIVAPKGKIELGHVPHCVLEVGQEDIPVACVSMGNPHAVQFIEESPDTYALGDIGPQVEHHPIFPARVNFEIAQVVDKNEVMARVWERGVGETLACGTGACAIAVAGQQEGLLDSPVDILLPGGRLPVQGDGRGEVLLTGPAEVVFEGEWAE